MLLKNFFKSFPYIIKPQLTVLTDPLRSRFYNFVNPATLFAKNVYRLLNRKKFYILFPKFNGHYAVTRSICEGLKKISFDYNYNPKNLDRVADHVVIPWGVQALRQALELKKHKKIKKIFTGPNIVISPKEHKGILLNSEIDGLINHCQYAFEHWTRDNKHLKPKCYEWAAGVDIKYWLPNRIANSKIKKILFFDKHVGPGTDKNRTHPYIFLIKKYGFQFSFISRIGESGYSKEKFLKELLNSSLLIGFTKYHGESQGIAWAEAWSTNVPTLIHQQDQAIWNGNKFPTHSAPFISPQTGDLFSDPNDFYFKFDNWIKGRYCFSPRNWVVQNMSDEKSAYRLIDIVFNPKTASQKLPFSP